MIRKIKKSFKRFARPKYYENYVEAFYAIGFLRKVLGVCVYTVKSKQGGRIIAHFSYFGFLCFVFWHSLYFFCVYRIYILDQTIMRSLYNTKLQRYGDEVERISTTFYVIYAMWKLPFDLHVDVHYLQLVVDIDKAIENLGEPLNNARYARATYVISILTILMSSTGAFVTWLSLNNCKAPFLLEKTFQVAFTDAMTLLATGRYTGYLSLLACKYKILNKILAAIDTPKVRNILVSVRGYNGGRTSSTFQFQDEHTNERLRSCGKIYSMLFDATETANRKFGLCITLTMFLCLVQIILHLFYFMEATASNLFNDFQRYVDFLIYVIWRIGFALVVIYLNIYFCENTVSEAKITSFVTHNIINSEVNPAIRTEALHLSLQIIHQLPVFTARGLCRIDYMLLLEWARAVVTFSVILLQFAAE